jgi:hypothetical protein
MTLDFVNMAGFVGGAVLAVALFGMARTLTMRVEA